MKNGARLIINQTNDAWFDPSSASRQHMYQCVFRCVENRVPALRCANTGASCEIDRFGRIRNLLQDDRGQVRFAGFKTCEVQVPAGPIPPTFYNRHGDLFAWMCAGLSGLCALGMVWLAHREKQSQETL
ncbi:MAG: hypothetical protein V2A34_12440 [Lentisphaerota bacterium]